MGEIFTYRTRVRYSETDQQGVVFNMWFLGYFDEALNAFIDERGPGYAEMIEGGHDVQLVHTEVDWRSSLRWRDEAEVAVSPSHVGTTSFTLDFAVRLVGEDDVRVTGRTVYVVVATDGSGKRTIPPEIRAALEPVNPLF